MQKIYHYFPNAHRINNDKFFNVFCLENSESARKIGSYLRAILDIEKDKAAAMKLRVITQILR